MAAPLPLNRLHKSRLMQVWRSAGWPCKDEVEIELLAAQLLTLHICPEGRETLRLTEAGLARLALARQANRRADSAHDRLAQRFAEQHLMPAGRIVWQELSLRALLEGPPREGGAQALFAAELAEDEAPHPSNVWRMARPDLFSVRNTTVAGYLQPMVHEVKASRADLLSDLRHAAKRESYCWLCSEAYYLFPAGTAEPEEIPEPFGVWVDNQGRFELLRPARHVSCTLPFAVWMALAKATPMQLREPDGDERLPQGAL